MENISFAKNLRRFRLEKGMTQEQLAEELGISPQSVSRWECGNTMPDVMLLPKLARIYGVTVDDLFREDSIGYANYAQRLLAVYEASGRTEDFLSAEQEFQRLMTGTHTADDLRSFGVLYYYMLKICVARSYDYLEAAIAAGRDSGVYSSAVQQRILLSCELGKGAEEVVRYEQMREEKPDDPLSWLFCIAAHYHAKEADLAYGIVLEALQRFPEDALLHTYAGDVCKALGYYEEAFRFWRKAQALNGSAFDAAYAMAFCYEELGQYREALAVWSALQQTLIGRGYTQESKLPAERARRCREQFA